MRGMLCGLAALVLLCGAGRTAHAGDSSDDAFADAYSYANVDQFRMTSFELALDVDFSSQQMRGGVALELQRLDPRATQLVLDTKDLDILDVTELTSNVLGAAEKAAPIWISRPFHFGKSDPILGRPLIVDLPASKAEKLLIRVDYETTPNARGLRWRVPTVGNPRQPQYLYTLSGPISARSWIPLQDTPRVRATYRARVHTPAGLVTLMGAHGDAKANRQGDNQFVMTRAVPASALALVIGDLRFKAIGPRTGVYAEGSAAPVAKEFGETETMLQAAEKLLGAYPWERFDIAVMPMSFPVGDVAYPDLAMISPTLIAGDKSMAGRIAYALAYGWSGNLVTNAEWRDRWLGEAMAGYLAHRIVEAVYGEGRDAHAGELTADGVLAADLQGRAYDDIFNEVPRQKGRLFFTWLEGKLGRERLDAMLRAFLARFAGHSVSTSQFVDFLHETTGELNPGPVTQAELSAWLFEANPRPDAAPPAPDVEADVKAMTGGDLKALQSQVRQWPAELWLRVLDAMPPGTGAARLAEIDRVFALSANPNAEIAAGWFVLALRAGDRAAVAPLEKFLLSTGRLALIEPLYEQLMQTEDGSVVAKRVYALVRGSYHPYVARRLDEIVKP
jgi:aminopeptidase N